MVLSDKRWQDESNGMEQVETSPCDGNRTMGMHPSWAMVCSHEASKSFYSAAQATDLESVGVVSRRCRRFGVIGCKLYCTYVPEPFGPSKLETPGPSANPGLHCLTHHKFWSVELKSNDSFHSNHWQRQLSRPLWAQRGIVSKANRPI